MVKRILVCLVVAIAVASSSGCTSMYQSQVAQISQYNEGVSEAKTLFSENEDFARENAQVVAKMITCNDITTDAYALLNVEETLEKESNETDKGFMYRNMHTLMTYSSVDTYEEYNNWINGVSSYTDSNGDHVYKYAYPCIIKSGYYSSVSSNFLCQFLVISFASGDSIRARVYWKDKHIQGIVLA